MTSTLIALNELEMITINTVNIKCVDNDGTLKMKQRHNKINSDIMNSCSANPNGNDRS